MREGLTVSTEVVVNSTVDDEILDDVRSMIYQQRIQTGTVVKNITNLFV